MPQIAKKLKIRRNEDNTANLSHTNVCQNVRNGKTTALVKNKLIRIE